VPIVKQARWCEDLADGPAGRAELQDASGREPPTGADEGADRGLIGETDPGQVHDQLPRPAVQHLEHIVDL